jgi:catechol 2,3-dioxygenase-like lactoylglutathione lyase family enzyme
VNDERPGFWIGHVTMTVRDPVAAQNYYVALGMRPVHSAKDFAIVELRAVPTWFSNRVRPSPGTRRST